MLGLSFEKTKLAIHSDSYITSNQALAICNYILKSINNDAGKEHEFYKLGQCAFSNKGFIEDSRDSEKAKELFGPGWEKERYHNLVRLGGDILRSGLAEHPKATILGGMLHYAKTLEAEQGGE